VSTSKVSDWNVPQDYMKDTINYVHRNNEKSQKQIHQMMEVLDLVDTYRELHPESVVNIKTSFK
jgi:hypothetical protein